MMRFIGILVILVLLIGGFGLYRGWFSISSGNGDTSSNITITIDKEKLKEDESKVKDAGHKLKEGVAGSDTPAVKPK